MNFLEQLVAEWCEVQGYFVRTNVMFGKREKGGWQGEMDVAAFDPQTAELIHYEVSMDADSWEERRKKFQKKFRSVEPHLTKLFSFRIKKRRKVVIVGTSKRGASEVLGKDIEVLSVPQLIAKVSDHLRKRHPLKDAIPEQYPILRAMQFTLYWGCE